MSATDHQQDQAARDGDRIVEATLQAQLRRQQTRLEIACMIAAGFAAMWLATTLTPVSGGDRRRAELAEQELDTEKVLRAADQTLRQSCEADLKAERASHLITISVPTSGAWSLGGDMIVPNNTIVFTHSAAWAGYLEAEPSDAGAP